MTDEAFEESDDGSEMPQLDGDASDEEVARYVAAGGFVVAAWIGALLLVLSFGQLYWSLLAGAYSSQAAIIIGVILLALGAVIFLRSRRVYQDMDVPYRRRSMAVATVVAGSGGIFWLLYLFLFVLVMFGVEILPSP